MTRAIGFDATLYDPPPLNLPPLSLLSLAKPLIQVDDTVARLEAAQDALAGSQVAVDNALKAYENASAEDRAAAQQAAQEAQDALAQQRSWVSTEREALADQQRWYDGFEYLPELTLSQGLEIFVPGSGSTKRTGSNQASFIAYDPFEVVARDDRSAFGFPASSLDERRQRAQRALRAHEAWEVEREFWTGDQIPTNRHLTASTATVTTSPHRTAVTHPDPSPAAGTVLGTAVGLKQSLAALVQSIASADAGAGMIHATPYLMQLWMSAYPYIRDNSGRIYTVNMNLMVPGYGYPGTGPDKADRTVADGVTNSTTTLTSATAAFTTGDVGRGVTGAGIPAGTTIVSRTNGTTVILSQAATASASGVSITLTDTGADQSGDVLQWAYATDTVYTLAGAMRTLPDTMSQAGPLTNVNNDIEVRAERMWALISNRLVRAAVLVDTTAA